MIRIKDTNFWEKIGSKISNTIILIGLIATLSKSNFFSEFKTTSGMVQKHDEVSDQTIISIYTPSFAVSSEVGVPDDSAIYLFFVDVYNQEINDDNCKSAMNQVMDKLENYLFIDQNKQYLLDFEFPAVCSNEMVEGSYPKIYDIFGSKVLIYFTGPECYGVDFGELDFFGSQELVGRLIEKTFVNEQFMLKVIESKDPKDREKYDQNLIIDQDNESGKAYIEVDSNGCK